MSERPNGTRLVALAEELGLPAPTLASDRPMWAKHAWVLALENDEAHKAELAAAIAKSLDEGSHRKFIHEVALDLRCANVVSRVYSAEFVRICEYAERDWPIPDDVVADRLQRLEDTYGAQRLNRAANRARIAAAKTPHREGLRTPASALREARTELAERIASRLREDLAPNPSGVLRWFVHINGTKAIVQCWRGSIWRVECSPPVEKPIESIDDGTRAEGWTDSQGHRVWQRWPADAEVVGLALTHLALRLHEAGDADDLEIVLDSSGSPKQWSCLPEDVFGSPSREQEQVVWEADAGLAVDALRRCLPAPAARNSGRAFTWRGRRLNEACSPEDGIGINLELASATDPPMPLLAIAAERVWIPSARALHILESEEIPDEWLASLRLPFPIVTFILEHPFVIPKKDLKRIPLVADGPAWRQGMNDLTPGAAVYGVTCTADSDGNWLPSIVVHVAKVQRRRVVDVLSVPGSTRSVVGGMAMKLGAAVAEHRPVVASSHATARAKLEQTQAQQVHFRLIESSRRGRKEQVGDKGPAPHSRRGHWRRQRVGPRENWHYELRWIPPTWVGATHGFPADHIYVLPARRAKQQPDVRAAVRLPKPTG